MQTIQSVIEAKKAVIMEAFDCLPVVEVEQSNEGLTRGLIEPLVTVLNDYPIGVYCMSDNGKKLVYCCDSLVLAVLAILWKQDIVPSDLLQVSDLLETAFETLLTLQTTLEP